MMNKRLISTILSFIFVFTSIFSLIPAGSAYASTVVLNDEDYAKASDVLREIIPAFPLFKGESVKRADFVAAVTMLLGKQETTNAATGFVDVPADHKYSGNIKYAKDLGLISSADSFSPDAPVTYAQALKILMCATGHGMKAELTGGFPSGYFKVANDIGLGQNIELQNEASLMPSEAIKLIFEAACADILAATSYGDSFEYAETEGKNILSVYHKIYIAEGIADANKLSGLYSISANMDSKGISVNGTPYYGDGYNSLLGKKVRVFFKGEKKREIISAYPVENKIYSFTHEDGLKLSSNAVTASRDESIKDENYILEGDYTVIFNGKYYAAAQNTYNDAMNPSAGMVELIDNDQNNKIDVISIKSIEYGVVDAINENEGKIYDKFKANSMRVLSDEIDYSIVGSDGSPLQLSDLTKNTVVGYAESKDGKGLEIIKFTERIGGTYNELTDDAVLVLGKDKKVSLSTYFIENIKALTDVKFGTQIVAYLGLGNQVVYIEEYSTSVSYGYLADFALAVGSGLNAEPCARIFSQEGEMLELPLAERVVYNGTGISRSTAATKLETLKAKAAILRVVKFAVNANGELNKLYETIENTEGVAAILNNVSAESRPVLFDDNTNHGSSSNLGKLYFTYGYFFPYFALPASTTILQVPTSAEFKDNMDFYNTYTSSTLSSWTSNNAKNINAYGYDVTKDGASFVLWTRDGAGSASVGDETPTAIVESITTGVDEDGNTVKVIKMYRSGNWIKLYTPAKYTAEQAALQTMINNLQPGDMARVAYDDKNIITALQIDFSYVNGKTVYSSTDTGVSGYGGRYVGYATGYAYTKSGNSAVLIKNKTIAEIENETALGTLAFSDIYPVNLGSGTTVYVELQRDRSTGVITGADVYKEPNNDAVESYFSAGKDADYIVSRSRFHAINLNVVYVN